MIESYPCLYSSTALKCTMSFMQSIVFASCTERDWSQWKLGWNLGLLTAVYSVLQTEFLLLLAARINYIIRIYGYKKLNYIVSKVTN